jgi:hypothetical protein
MSSSFFFFYQKEIKHQTLTIFKSGRRDGEREICSH